ncbi:CRISPR-associated endonuclease Cas1 [Tamilnaduibacter salinus]|uniref:CRISPR-associated endonuclease Cas1 n=1 Tax=Tamilnaduibacter salinus TaxID=1484056 RepID=A0A2A2I833_9GAMM|nr:CRISPR-associated endonuclease Cas1 [Tamilnaduibacter salinus]PAV27548.1 CRISPR-associated endonuclease Cas1 [Tamilnaduibacter salinus]
MRHLVLADYGRQIGVTGNRVVVREGDKTLGEYPLRRLRSITLAKQGVGLSSNLVLACANNGISLHFHDFRDQPVVSLHGSQSHAVPKVRRDQFAFSESPQAREWSREVIVGKLRNQRATLLYFGKYLKSQGFDSAESIERTAGILDGMAGQVSRLGLDRQWRESLMGLEGIAANHYWSCLRETGLFPESFEGRQGRGAQDVTNQALNFGYALLKSALWRCVVNAGLEVYVGCLHTARPGRPALVLDLMEEYRAWVVDRLVIKMRQDLAAQSHLNQKLKRRVIKEFHQRLASSVPYKNKRLRLESAMQRQVYHLVGHMMEGRRYRSMRFRW